MWWKQRRVYADAAAATPLAPSVRTRLIELLELYGNPGALHAEGVRAHEALEEARAEAARAIEAHADEIVFTGSGTEANNLALFGVYGDEYAHQHALTSAIEHPSILEPLKAMEKKGLAVTYLSVGEDGRISIGALEDALTEKTKLVSVGLINSEIGTIQDVRAIAKSIRAHNKKYPHTNTLFHIDAAQAPLWMQLRVPALGCDLMTLDAQKVLGPKGVGLLYIKRGTKITAQTLGGGQERGLRSGTENVPLVGAFARALTLAHESCEKNSEQVRAVRDTLLRCITKRIPGALVNGGMEARIPNNLNISIPGLVGERAVLALSAWGVACSTRSACAAKDEDLSHVLLALTHDPKRAREAIRFTFLPGARVSDAEYIARQLVRAVDLYKDADK